MSELLKQGDICDAGGYLLAPSFVLDKVNERIERLVKERDEARAKLIWVEHMVMCMGAYLNGVKDVGKKEEAEGA